MTRIERKKERKVVEPKIREEGPENTSFHAREADTAANRSGRWRKGSQLKKGRRDECPQESFRGAVVLRGREAGRGTVIPIQGRKSQRLGGGEKSRGIFKSLLLSWI